MMIVIRLNWHTYGSKDQQKTMTYWWEILEEWGLTDTDLR